MNEYILPLNISGKDLLFKIKEFSGEIDVEDLLQVQYYNIIGDVITFPVIFNRISLLKAEVESLEQEAKVDFDIFVAQKEEQKRKELTGTSKDSKGNEKLSKPTAKEVENALLMDTEYRERKGQLIEIHKQVKIIDGLYWSAKSKQKMLEVISAKIKPEDYENEIVEGEINHVKIKISKSLIPKHKK